MATEEMVVDVSQDWVLACDVQQGFMQAPCSVSESFDYSARCRQIERSAAIAAVLSRLKTIAWHSSLEMPRAKVWPPHS
jgi:hypothetical protein